MSPLAFIVIAALSIWDYPSRQLRHEQLRAGFLQAVGVHDTAAMTALCRQGVELLPDDPTWHFNLACSLAYGKNPDPALDELEKAVDLGFRDSAAIAADADLKRLSGHPRFREIVDYADSISGRPLTRGPNACFPQAAPAGGSVALGEQNFRWDFDSGLLVAELKLLPGSGASAGDLYMNRDDGHSQLKSDDFPGITVVKLDSDGRLHHADLDIPNVVFHYPLFGNASRAYVEPRFWRSLPRMMMTRESWRMKAYQKLYLSNQFWVFPAHQDCPPVGRFGDVFASMCPYFLVTAGSSFSDQPYLRAALEVSRSLRPETKAALVGKGLMVPTIMTMIRKSLVSVSNEVDYLTGKAHPSAFPAGGLDVPRLKRRAAELLPDRIPPLVTVSVLAARTEDVPTLSELTYASAFASAFVLRSEDAVRRFRLVAEGAAEYAFSVVRGETAAELRTNGVNIADITIERSRMSVTNRIDVAVFGRNAGTGWGAPGYVSFAVVDPTAPYSDPVLTQPAESVEGSAK